MDQQKPTIAIIGATGATGKFVLQDAIERGFNIRVLARKPEKLSDITAPIKVFKGGIQDTEVIKELFDGVDVVLSTLGTTKKPNYIVEKGVRVMLDAMDAQDSPPRFIHMSAVGLGDSKVQCKNSLLWTFIVKVTFPLIGSELFADMERAEDLILVKKKDTSVIMRAAVLNNKAAKGYSVRKHDEKAGKMFISRADIAVFMLDAVEDTSFDGKAVSIFSA